MQPIALAYAFLRQDSDSGVMVGDVMGGEDIPCVRWMDSTFVFFFPQHSKSVTIVLRVFVCERECCRLR